jgi:hypothetical protein
MKDSVMLSDIDMMQLQNLEHKNELKNLQYNRLTAQQY